MSNLYIVRHAESLGNIDKKVYYQMNDCDIPITDLGKTQALAAGKTLNDLITSDRGDTLFISSTFKRATDTRDILLEECLKHTPGLKEYFDKKTCPLCVERSWGGLREIVDGKLLNRDEHFNFYFQPPHGGESFFQCYQRVVLFFQELRHKHGKFSNIVVISHGEWIRLALMYLDGKSVEEFTTHRKNPKNCEILVRKLLH